MNVSDERLSMNMGISVYGQEHGQVHGEATGNDNRRGGTCVSFSR